MFSMVLIAISTGLREVSESAGKLAVKNKAQTLYTSVFLGSFFSAIFIGVFILFGAPLTFDAKSLPYFIPRMILELIEAYLVIVAINRADRSTFGFFRLITIPLLVIVDITASYRLSIMQITGMGIILAALLILVSIRKHNRRAAGLIIVTGVLSVITTSLYKYDITHFNSVAGEQSIFYLILLTFFAFIAWNKGKENVFRLLLRPRSLIQSSSGGLAGVLESFAYSLSPASVVLTAKRGFSIVWTVISGYRVFKEDDLVVKSAACAAVLVGLTLLVL